MIHRVLRHDDVERDILDLAGWIARDSREAALRANIPMPLRALSNQSPSAEVDAFIFGYAFGIYLAR